MIVLLLLALTVASFVAGLVVADWQYDYLEVRRQVRRLDREVARERRMKAEALHRAEVMRHINVSARPTNERRSP